LADDLIGVGEGKKDPEELRKDHERAERVFESVSHKHILRKNLVLETLHPVTGSYQSLADMN
jgi:hypothetical protein